MELQKLNFQEITNLSRESAKEWSEENNAKRYLEGMFPTLKEDEIFIVRASLSGQGNTFFIKEVTSESYFEAFKSKDFRSKEFYLLKN